MKASLRGAAANRSRYSKENTATMTISPIRSSSTPQGGRLVVASRMTDKTLTTISARMRFSNARAYGPSLPTRRSAITGTDMFNELAAIGG
jgi:hypothetical protein